jgi:putative transposase
LVDVPQHIIQRGNNRQATFFAEEDYLFERQHTYRDLFSAELDSRELAAIRSAANRGWPLGGNRFKDEIERALKCAVRPPKMGRPPKIRTTTPRAEQRRPYYRAKSLH